MNSLSWNPLYKKHGNTAPQLDLTWLDITSAPNVYLFPYTHTHYIIVCLKTLECWDLNIVRFFNLLRQLIYLSLPWKNNSTQQSDHCYQRNIISCDWEDQRRSRVKHLSLSSIQPLQFQTDDNYFLIAAILTPKLHMRMAYTFVLDFNAFIAHMLIQDKQEKHHS